MWSKRTPTSPPRGPSTSAACAPSTASPHLGGARLRLVVVDSTSDPATAVAAAQRLVSTTRVVAAVGMGISPLTIPVQPVFERAQIPLLVHSIAPAITTSGYHYTFRI